ncbi:MAG TPA: hypothetical protein VL651_08740 [Bacteroidia bacterium]|jgi:hypothetical protein|nr:hypothetical protein [Bacteroidia bacterium]
MVTTLHYPVEDDRNKKARIVAWTCTSVFTIALILLLILWKIITPIPAMPPDPEVISVEIGIDDGSGGDATNPGGGSQGNTGHPGVNDGGNPTQAPPTPTSDGSVTDPNSTASVTANPNYHSNVTQSEIDATLASFNKNKGKATIALGGQGSGDPYTGGLGNGSGDGPGPGTGGDPGTTGHGGNPNGTTFRSIKSKPDIINPTQEEGIVEVLVHVRQDGTVSSVEIGSHGTTGNSVLQATATQSAHHIIFNADPSAPVDELISIEIKFTLR